MTNHFQDRVEINDRLAGAVSTTIILQTLLFLHTLMEKDEYSSPVLLLIVYLESTVQSGQFL